MTDFLDIPTEDWEEAKRRESLIRSLANRKNTTRTEVAHVADEIGISVIWTYQLLKRWKEDPRTSSLLPNKTGRKCGSQMLAPEVENIIQTSIEGYYASSQKPSKTALWRHISAKCRANGLQPPGKETVRRRVNTADQMRISKRREGKAKSHSKYGAVSGQFDASEPMELIQIDHTLVDIIIVDEIMRRPIGRPWLTLAMDIRTRMVVGFLVSLDPPSSLSVALTVSQMIWEKAPELGQWDIDEEWPCHGIPKRIHLDNAKEFRAEALKRGCEEYGIILEYRPVATPWYGGHVERLLGTLMRQAHLLPGSTFSNPQERGIYDSEGKSAMTLAELERWLAVQILGVYHNQIHSMIGVTPNAAWRSALGEGWEPRVTNDKKRLFIDFLPFEKRIPRRDGIRLFNIGYWHDLLPSWAMRKPGQLPVKYDPRDLSKVWLKLPDGEYAELRYKDPSRPKITLWEHKVALAHMREKGRETVNESALFAAIEESRRIVAEAAETTKLARRTMQRRISSERSVKAAQPTGKEKNDKEPDYQGHRKTFDVEYW